MKEYIDREAIVAVIEEKQKELCPVGLYGRSYVYGSDREKYDNWDEIIDSIENLQAADVVEVVRCKDCKHFVCDMDLNHEEYPNEIEADGMCQITDKYCDMPHFCSYGERRENG